MGIYDSIVITGGGGMLANALNDLLTTRGHQTALLKRAETDIAKPEHIKAIFDRKPSLLLNCAAHTKVDLCEQEPELANTINGYAVGQMAELSRQHGTVLVHVSTDFVFDGKGTRPYLVNEPTIPISAYGKSKLLGEIELQKNAPARWLIVRTAWVYGRHGMNFPRTMVTAAKAGKPLNVVGDQVGSPTYTVDLAEGILALLDAGANGIHHFTNGGQTNWCDFARETLKVFGIDHPVGAITSLDWAKIKPNSAPRPSYSVLDLSEYEKATGRKPRAWQDALVAFRNEVEAAGSF